MRSSTVRSVARVAMFTVATTGASVAARTTANAQTRMQAAPSTQVRDDERAPPPVAEPATSATVPPPAAPAPLDPPAPRVRFGLQGGLHTWAVWRSYADDFVAPPAGRQSRAPANNTSPGPTFFDAAVGGSVTIRFGPSVSRRVAIPFEIGTAVTAMNAGPHVAVLAGVGLEGVLSRRLVASAVVRFGGWVYAPVGWNAVSGFAIAQRFQISLATNGNVIACGCHRASEWTSSIGIYFEPGFAFSGSLPHPAVALGVGLFGSLDRR